jgi:hypothetical protein
VNINPRGIPLFLKPVYGKPRGFGAEYEEKAGQILGGQSGNHKARLTIGGRLSGFLRSKVLQ